MVSWSGSGNPDQTRKNLPVWCMRVHSDTRRSIFQGCGVVANTAVGIGYCICEVATIMSLVSARKATFTLLSASGTCIVEPGCH